MISLGFKFTSKDYDLGFTNKKELVALDFFDLTHLTCILVSSSIYLPESIVTSFSLLVEWTFNVYINHVFIIQSSIEENLGYLYSLNIVTLSAMIMVGQVAME